MNIISVINIKEIRSSGIFIVMWLENIRYIILGINHDIFNSKEHYNGYYLY